MTLNGRVAMITGATGGLGRVVAAALAGEGANLALVGTDASRLDALVSELGLPPDRCLTLLADLRDAKAAARAVDGLVERFERLDIVAHLVGGYQGGTPLIDIDPGELRGMLDQHVWTTFNLTRAAVPIMTRGKWGRIVAVTTAALPQVPAKLASYGAAKAAQEAMLHSLSRDLAGSGVTVNLIAVKSIDAAHSGKAGWTTPEQIAAAIVWLCSDGASVMSGARIPLHS
jgi:NAD(P)-dependent dehydrogenase (short-subunit alcohol dehydrogenase family)